MRKLASVQKITELLPIKDADLIEVAKVLGWYCVVQKGEFNVGDLVVYCEVDSLLPLDYKTLDGSNPFQFLIDKGIKRIRTVRLRGQISQGIVFPLSILNNVKTFIEGEDVTNILGIEKYEAPIPACLTGKMKAGFPSFIPKTDETRVQILQELLNKYNGLKCYTSIKMDGTSSTYFFNHNEFGVCGRSIEYFEDEDNTYWKMAKKYNIEDILRDVNGNYAIQGEVCGENIQSNKYKLKGQELFVFNVFDINKYRYLNYEEFIKFCTYYDLQTVPILDDDFDLINDIDKLVELSKGNSLIGPMKREGIVIRPKEEIFDPQFGRISLKVINPDFFITIWGIIMRKEIKEQREVITKIVFTCDFCNEQLKFGRNVCAMCGKDICEKCIGKTEDELGDYPTHYCKSCWEKGKPYKEKIQKLQEEIDKLEDEWLVKCTYPKCNEKIK